MADAAELQKQLAALRKAEQSRAGALMKDCLNRPNPALTAQPSGPPISPMEYLLVRVHESVYSDDGADVNTADRIRADNIAQRLNLLLENILESIPGQQNTPSDVLRYWGSQLKQYDTPNCPVSSYFASTLEACYSKAQEVVKRELADPRTELGAAAFAIKAASTASGSKAGS